MTIPSPTAFEGWTEAVDEDGNKNDDGAGISEGWVIFTGRCTFVVLDDEAEYQFKTIKTSV